MTATQTARCFSAVLDRVAAGEEIEVTRRGVAVAIIVPPTRRRLSAERFRELLATAPPIDEDFVDDLGRLRASTGPPDGATG